MISLRGNFLPNNNFIDISQNNEPRRIKKDNLTKESSNYQEYYKKVKNQSRVDNVDKLSLFVNSISISKVTLSIPNWG
jgi:hypothetical protein